MCFASKDTASYDSYTNCHVDLIFSYVFSTQIRGFCSYQKCLIVWLLLTREPGVEYC